MKTIAFIDNFINVPVNHCVNEFIERTGLPCTYHQPARFGLDSLYKLTKADAFILLGSASHVNQPEQWHEDLMAFLMPFIEEGTPILGICFGHQLFARYFGSEVDFIDNIPTYFQLVRDVKFHYQIWGQNFGSHFPMPYSHKQAIKKLSNEFEIFASTPELPFEGIKHKKYNLWSVQGHPEASHEFIRETLKIKEEKKIDDIKKAGNHFLDSFANII